MEHTNDQSQYSFRKAQRKEDPIHFQWAQPPSGEIQVTRKLTTTNPGNRESSAGTDPPQITLESLHNKLGIVGVEMIA